MKHIIDNVGVVYEYGTPTGNRFFEATREYWLYEFAGRALQGLSASGAYREMELRSLVGDAIDGAEILLAELEKREKDLDNNKGESK